MERDRSHCGENIGQKRRHSWSQNAGGKTKGTYVLVIYGCSYIYSLTTAHCFPPFILSIRLFFPVVFLSESFFFFSFFFSNLSTTEHSPNPSLSQSPFPKYLPNYLSTFGLPVSLSIVFLPPTTTQPHLSFQSLFLSASLCPPFPYSPPLTLVLNISLLLSLLSPTCRLSNLFEEILLLKNWSFVVGCSMSCVIQCSKQAIHSQ